MLNQLIQQLLGRGISPSNIPTGNPLQRPTSPVLVDSPTVFQGFGPDMTPEPTMVENVPAPESAGPSSQVPAGSTPAESAPRRKRGGILGALENVFMPEPGSRWAAALRGGVWDAKANQAAYRQGQVKIAQDNEMADIKRQEATAKLKNLLAKGEYVVIGNNLAHFPPGGGEPTIITPPTTPTETQRLLDDWKVERNPEVKDLLRSILLKNNNPEIIRLKGEVQGRVAETRAAATARHRAPSKGGGGKGRVQIPAGAVVVE